MYDVVNGTLSLGVAEENRSERPLHAETRALSKHLPRKMTEADGTPCLALENHLRPHTQPEERA